MWTRAELKSKAKNVLRKHYLHAFIVSLILVFVSGEVNNKGGLMDFKWETGSESFAMFAILASLIGFVLFVLFVLFNIFVGGPLEVGGRKYYIKATENDESDLSHVTSMFHSEYYGNVVITMLYQKVIIFLWFLALIVPGIIKMYAYSMVPYILADNPEISHKEALKLSDEMTYTHKLDMFVLDISFIGWYILGGILFGIGQFLVNPYVDATKAQLYRVLKREIIAENLAEESDFRSKGMDDPALLK